MELTGARRLLAVYGQSLAETEVGRIWVRSMLRTGSACTEGSSATVMRAKRKALRASLRDLRVFVHWQVTYERTPCGGCSCPKVQLEDFLLVEPRDEPKMRGLGYLRSRAPKHR